MPKAIKLTLARLKEILRRQDPPQWGKPYDPAIWDKLVAGRAGGGSGRLVWDYWERKVLAEGVPL